MVVTTWTLAKKYTRKEKTVTRLTMKEATLYGRDTAILKEATKPSLWQKLKWEVKGLSPCCGAEIHVWSWKKAVCSACRKSS